MPNSRQRSVSRKHRQRSARQRSQRRQELGNAKTKTINEMCKDGSLPKELEERVTLRKSK